MGSKEDYKNSKQLEAAGKLSAPVAHDMNNLLSGILGYCDLILSESAAEHLKPHMEEISNAAKRMASMARMLLVFSRKGIPHPEIVNVNDIIHEIEPFILHLAGPGTGFSVVEEPALWQVRADSAHMKRAILSVAIDIGERMPEGGIFVLKTQNIVTAPKEIRDCPKQSGNYVSITAIAEGDIAAIPSIYGRITSDKAEQFAQKAGLGIYSIFEAIRTCGGEIFWEKAAAGQMRIKMYFPAIK